MDLSMKNITEGSLLLSTTENNSKTLPPECNEWYHHLFNQGEIKDFILKDVR